VGNTVDGKRMWKKAKLMRISKYPFQVQLMVDYKQLENAKNFGYLSSVVTNDARRARKIKSRISRTQATFNRKKILFISKLDLNLRQKKKNQ